MSQGQRVVPRRVLVLVVEDSLTVRARIVATLRSDPAIEVIGEARDGESGIEMCLRLRPDVVTMDMMLPGISGLEAVQYLMRRCPTPILVISAPGNRAGFIDTLAALAAGAVDVLDKPDATTQSNEAWDRHLLSTVKLVAKIRVITHFGAAAGSIPSARVPRAVDSSPAHPAHPAHQKPTGRFAMVAIGASTGGPTAVSQVLRDLPTSFALPVLLVLHVSESFGTAFAEWLQDVTERTVRLATHGEPVESGAGQVIMAPPGIHLMVRHGMLILNNGPERHSCRPSVDVLFESLAREPGPRVAACLLTGMGKDGASGLLEIQRSGGLTIAQDEATSAVFGMPGEAVRLRAADHVLPIDQIGPALARLTMNPAEQT
jgi:two-component system, chemotaxis family, protein-glutamate methylesterase/glutaminase